MSQSKSKSKREIAEENAKKEMEKLNLFLSPEMEAQFFSFLVDKHINEKTLVSNTISAKIKNLRDLNIIPNNTPVNMTFAETMFNAGALYHDEVQSKYLFYFVESSVNLRLNELLESGKIAVVRPEDFEVENDGESPAMQSHEMGVDASNKIAEESDVVLDIKRVQVSEEDNKGTVETIK